jgi:hypothetical protein
LLVVRRRTIFATPFVVVLGCSHPGDRPTTTQPVRDDAAAGSTRDGDEPVDVKDPGPGVTASNGGNTPCPEGRRCNPPAPVSDKVIVDGSVIGTPHQQDDGLYFQVMLDQGEVTPAFKGVFLDEKGPIVGSDFAIKNRTGRTVTCLLKGREHVPSKRVRIYEPGAL